MAADPFEGDFGVGGAGDRIIEDQMVWCRKPGICHTCDLDIVPTMRIRRRAEVYDGEFMRFAWCQPCCEAMANYIEDPDTYEALIAAGQQRREARMAGGGHS